jgi:hypothetical protein
MKIEFDIFNRELFRTLTFSLKFQKKAQVSIIYKKYKIQKVDKMEEKRQRNSYLSFRVM